MRSNLCRVCAHRANVSLERAPAVPFGSLRHECPELLKTPVRRINCEAAAQNRKPLLTLAKLPVQVREQQIGLNVFRVVANGLLKIRHCFPKLSRARQRESAIKI